jgi:phenylacetic acid degradation operon negative regulatory protein
VIVPASLKRQRDSLREELAWLGFGQITPGVFVHPTHKEETIRARLAELESSGAVIVAQGARVAPTSDTNLVAIGWDFGDLARRYRRFVTMFGPLDAAPHDIESSNGESGEGAFILRTLLLHEYRKIHLRDPLLPGSLLPQNWPGAAAHEICRRLYAKVFPVSERYLSATVQTIAGSLPKAAPEIFQRFGGLPRP